MKKIYLTPIFIIVITIIIYHQYRIRTPVKFYPILTQTDSLGKYEVFVVHNAPCDTQKIKEIIIKFDFNTLPLDTLKKYKTIERLFYRETKYMTKNFKEGKEYHPTFSTWDNIQDFNNHTKDVLMRTFFYLTGRKSYSTWVNWDWFEKGEFQYINWNEEYFSNLDSFYKEKKKLYNTY
ncbi:MULTISPECIES: hypothetical protein [Bacteroidaceae]|uniref:Uncharacterized protein n=1 Tax=Phocaeicola barnesiae TaxID=376804 RepID=A0AAW5N7S9_9BACT|nr:MULTISPECIES: hypothetical protein [Bacteroidaceae]MBM6671227.1 hypothetical protein [Phocaeicola coprophilus]MBM6718987.1 hypothetical protein [Bacteroides gallinaceum]MBM6782623.1 hypothetical protein [Bacteroides mediterraneensis]MCR8874402.1 hypothetical protein [Phocaeicola barnesiae]